MKDKLVVRKDKKGSTSSRSDCTTKPEQDNLEKREVFASKLRASKRKEIISQKRKKLNSGIIISAAKT